MIFRLIILTTLILFNFIACGAEKAGNMQKNSNHTFTNHLANENSPYLLSHSHNPVDWYPWSEEALEKAKSEDKLIFLSIGYAACHWCHVMERESFENKEIAQILNENFISIKVDREQRPDLDEIYMSFTTALTGHGGWPMTVFLTPNLKPFFAGTYFPPDDRYGRPGFKKLITEISTAYKTEREQIWESSDNIFKQVNQRINNSVATTLLNKNFMDKGATQLLQSFDPVYGGLGQAPKFPHATELSYMLRYYRLSGDLSYLQAVKKTLLMMARGGIYDQLGGGFARYSTDNMWLIPHFEKMLYDNALLVSVYAEAYQITGNEEYLNIVTGTLDFILREITDKTGGFYSAIDADSEGHEGKFYVWGYEEIKNLLPENLFESFVKYYNVTPQGNFEGKNILNLTEESFRYKSTQNEKDFLNNIEKAKDILFVARSKRIRPLTDDKQLTSWNGMALTAFCKGYQITGNSRYLKAAVNNATFVNDILFKNSNLTHSYREGNHLRTQMLEDYAFYVDGLLNLYETDPSGNNNKWLELAIKMTERAIELFMDKNSRFYLRPEGLNDLIYRPSEESDGAVPASGSYMIRNLIKINRLTENKNYLSLAESCLKSLSGYIAKSP
ncbi:MAG: thioredoxin domain-containing protein, partial [candidate division Zixibacteria bacterium]|nr:thioredoxin domain-containing protein [candidate division Zixibacteria bacterium]